jgi:hypothetical protein
LTQLSFTPTLSKILFGQGRNKLMKPIFRKLLANLFIVLIPTFFCTLMATPLSLMLPLKCPEGSQVIGIECFDADYNNTTPWYRRDFCPSQMAFPFLLAGFTAYAAWNFFTTPTSKYDPNRKKAAIVHPADFNWEQVKQSALENPEGTLQNLKTSRSRSKQWLPVNCPHCGGSISTQNVEWLSRYEAKCPYCGSVLKE